MPTWLSTKSFIVVENWGFGENAFVHNTLLTVICVLYTFMSRKHVECNGYFLMLYDDRSIAVYIYWLQLMSESIERKNNEKRKNLCY